MEQKNIKFILSKTTEDFEKAKILFNEYSDSLDFSLNFQDFQKELQTISEKYASPIGALILCYVDNIAVGCVGIRNLEENIAEIKRLFVKPEYRSLKLGKELMILATEEAKNLGYNFIRLDTVREMKAAINLYEKLGFYEIEPYCYNPLNNPVYMEKEI